MDINSKNTTKDFQQQHAHTFHHHFFHPTNTNTNTNATTNTTPNTNANATKPSSSLGALLLDNNNNNNNNNNGAGNTANANANTSPSTTNTTPNITPNTTPSTTANRVFEGVDLSSPTPMCGWLEKYDLKLDSWQMKWCVLSNGQLAFSDRPTTDPTHSVAVSNIASVRTTKHHHQHHHHTNNNNNNSNNSQHEQQQHGQDSCLNLSAGAESESATKLEKSVITGFEIKTRRFRHMGVKLRAVGAAKTHTDTTNTMNGNTAHEQESIDVVNEWLFALHRFAVALADGAAVDDCVTEEPSSRLSQSVGGRFHHPTTSPSPNSFSSKQNFTPTTTTAATTTSPNFRRNFSGSKNSRDNVLEGLMLESEGSVGSGGEEDDVVFAFDESPLCPRRALPHSPPTKSHASSSPHSPSLPKHQKPKQPQHPHQQYIFQPITDTKNTSTKTTSNLTAVKTTSSHKSSGLRRTSLPLSHNNVPRNTHPIPLPTVVGNNSPQTLARRSVDPSRIRAATAMEIGRRSKMEDRCVVNRLFGRNAKKWGGNVCYAGVFDGHLGDAAAEFAVNNLAQLIENASNSTSKSPQQQSATHEEVVEMLKMSFHECDQRFLDIANRENLDCGTTALVCLIFPSYIYTANAGDCKAVLCRAGVALDLSQEHKPDRDDERLRIEAAGGWVEIEQELEFVQANHSPGTISQETPQNLGFRCVGRVNGELGVSRALGDRKFKKGNGNHSISEDLVTCDPEMCVVPITTHDEFLLMASDGFWDVFTSQDAVDFVRTKCKKHLTHANDITAELVYEALKRGSLDNISIVFVDL